MTDKELRRLKRSELMELLLMQSRASDEQKQEIAALQEKLNSRKLEQEDVGSIAEASLKVNHVFEAAQAAADQYLANLAIIENRCREMETNTYKKCGDLEREAQQRCEAMERKCAEMEQAAKERCEAMLQQAKEEADQLLKNAGKKDGTESKNNTESKDGAESKNGAESEDVKA